MSKLQGMKTFFNEVATEMKKTTWPGREELTQSTIVVIVFMALLGFFVAVSDKVIAVVLKFLTT
jgi:preprotein translocase subunit SecE